MTVYIDDADETEEGEFVHNDRHYFLFRIIADTEDELHAMAKKIPNLVSEAFDGDVYHITAGKRATLVALGAKEVNDKVISMMLANLYLGDEMGDEKPAGPSPARDTAASMPWASRDEYAKMRRNTPMTPCGRSAGVCSIVIRHRTDPPATKSLIGP